MPSYDIIVSDDDEGAKRQEELIAISGKVSIDIEGNEFSIEFDGISEELQDKILTALETQ